MARRPSPARQTLVALFEPGTPLEPGLERCRALGVPDESLDVLSTIPLSHPHAQLPARFPLHRWAVIGGIGGLLSGLALAGGTALLYPLNTGGFPIVAPPVVGLMAFEGMMLFAVLLTFLAMVHRLRRTDHAPLDPRIDDGMIGLSILMGDGTPPVGALQQALLETGARQVIQVPLEA